MNGRALFLILVVISLVSCASSGPSPDTVPYRQE
jgi:hypothetical protein